MCCGVYGKDREKDCQDGELLRLRRASEDFAQMVSPEGTNYSKGGEVMTEIEYYEAFVNVSGITKLGVYARSYEEAEKLLNEHIDYLGVDKFSPDLDLDVREVVSIEKADKRYASELVNDKDDFEEGTNG